MSADFLESDFVDFLYNVRNNKSKDYDSVQIPK